MHQRPSPETPVVSVDDPFAGETLAGALSEVLAPARNGFPVNVLAIGSDRTTGDCLGPLVGEFLAGQPGVSVYGTLDAPVHAANLTEVVQGVQGFTIAVDAALGNPVGGICVRMDGLTPGAAFGRSLPTVGNISISALVCAPGPLGFERLRSVRLGFVRRMAHVIATGVAGAVGAMQPSALVGPPSDAHVWLDLTRLEARAEAAAD